MIKIFKSNEIYFIRKIENEVTMNEVSFFSSLNEIVDFCDRNFSGIEIDLEDIQEEIKEELVIISPLQPTNAEIAQMISDLQIDLIIGGGL